MGAVRERVEEPPVHVRFGFWVIGLRLDERWLPWAEREIRSIDYTVRRAASHAAAIFVLLFALNVNELFSDGMDNWDLFMTLGVPFASLLGGLWGGERARRLALRYQRGELKGNPGFSARDFLIGSSSGIVLGLVIIAIVFALT